MSKETLKSNVVDASTLFIGVGGTGGKIVRKVAELCRDGETDNISFACLDTNVNDLTNIAQSNKHIYYIQTSNTQTVGSYLHYDRDAFSNWFPKNAVIYDKTVSEGAGQVRAISRLALNATIKTGNISNLYRAIDDLFRQSGSELKQTFRCCIVSTASGGTGSGIILPLAMFIRDYVKSKYPNTSLIIRSLILLPETLDSVIDSNAERESQRRNAYATIKEINAFMMKGSGFFDVAPELHRYRDLHIDIPVPASDELRSLSELPFDFCFLMDGQNAEDSTLVNLNQYLEQAAQALYEQNIGPMQGTAYSVEDNIIKEMSNPGNLGRNRFGGIGASVLRYPYDKITEYISYDWARANIGGGDAAKWSRYDRAFEAEYAEARKRDTPEDELPKRETTYCDLIDHGEDTFSKNLRSSGLSSADERLDDFFASFDEQVFSAVMENRAVAAANEDASFLSVKLDYKGQDKYKQKGQQHLNYLRKLEMAINANAEKIAKRSAQGFFISERPTAADSSPFTVEALMKNSHGDVLHPNAMRYMLYKLKSELHERVEIRYSKIHDDIRPSLTTYSPKANKSSLYNLKFNDRGKDAREESCIDDVCSVEKTCADNPGFLEGLVGGKDRGLDQIYDIYNKTFPSYYSVIMDLAHAMAEYEAYRIAEQYVKELCEMFERFYATFNDKVKMIERRQLELVANLQFHKGDSTLNICSNKDHLEQLSRMTKTMREQGAMLDPDLNARIFDAIRGNVQYERQVRTEDFVEEDSRTDVFEDIILGYFKDSVQDKCDVLDMNIITAIAMERRLDEWAKISKEDPGSENEMDYEKVGKEQLLKHIKHVLDRGARLAAPSIQRLVSEEPRQVMCSAYNKSLLDMLDYRVKDFLPNGKDSDTVSKYEIHFFNALYNLTPDKLNKFASPLRTDSGMQRRAGMYHKAYVDYSRNIGPDSTKNMLISTHIDKRWDSIAAMPELDLDYQNTCMMRVHKAMIYGIVYGVIQSQILSRAAREEKYVYRFESSSERMMDMIVSNGTLCDQFYEILDSLYISPAFVMDIDRIVKARRQKDLNRNANYEDTTFAKALTSFSLHCLNHKEPTSLFEIPLVYYNSLPNNLRYTSELSSFAEAVVCVLKEELNRWEKAIDARFMLCDILRDQFVLLVENYKMDEALSAGVSLADNEMVDLIYRRIRTTLSATPEPSDYEKVLAELKGMLV